MRTEAEAALGRILRANRPGKVSLAGAYALGYGALGLAQRDGDGPDWYHDLDPLDTLFLGTAWPSAFSDAVEFGNARSAWLRLLRDTPHWRGIEVFVREVLAASEEHALPVDDGELMLLLAARLEPAGLDRRRLPASLLPRAALSGARFVDGPPADLPLPDPPADAAERVARLWAATEVALRHDGTAADALREGLHLLGRAGLPVRTEPGLLLIALYAGLAAGDDEQLREAGERAAAWAFGLREESPLLPVVDVLLVATHRGLGVDETLARLFGVAAFTEPVAPADCGWHGAPGAALVDSAFELGYRQVLTSDRKIVRLDPGDVALLEAQTRRFEEKFGRPPGPDDPLFFDPDADQPARMSPTGMERDTVEMLEAAGISPAWVYAYQHTGGLLPRPDGGFVTDADRDEWHETVARHTRAHGGNAPDHRAEAAKLGAVVALFTIHIAAADPEYAAVLVDRLQAPDSADDSETALLADHLRRTADGLTDRMRDDAVARARAVELARAWGGRALADRVRDLTEQPTAGPATADVAVLLVASAAALASPDQ